VSGRSASSRSKAWAALACALAAGGPAFGVEAGAEPPSANSGEYLQHTVARGETLSEIALRYGVSVERLIRANQIDDPSRLWAGKQLRIPLGVEAESAPPPEETNDAAERDSAEIAALLERCEAELRAARFERALASARELRDRIDARDASVDRALRVRLEIASATAQVALGQSEEALASLGRALDADPNLELDPALTSPKVLAVFRAARARTTPAR